MLIWCPRSCWLCWHNVCLVVDYANMLTVTFFANIFAKTTIFEKPCSESVHVVLSCPWLCSHWLCWLCVFVHLVFVINDYVLWHRVFIVNDYTNVVPSYSTTISARVRVFNNYSTLTWCHQDQWLRGHAIFYNIKFKFLLLYWLVFLLFPK